jgi:murein L,D-transpeptidase YafK
MNVVRAFAPGLSVLAVAGFLAGCSAQNTTARSDPNRHLKPLSYSALQELRSKGFTREDPILVRLYKQESEFEVWKQAKSDGKYRLFKIYKICKWSGELGPKFEMGDRQAPEGFYTITPAQMNPKSSYYLSFNTGFPNAYDRAHGRTGEHLMVHGACSSAGCYSMTDASVAEIYALARDAFASGQTSFQLQAFPFRMTAENLARHRRSPHFAFWRMLKEGNDHFEVTKLEPTVAVCGKRYVFNAESGEFSPTAPCPQLKVPAAVATAVTAKQQSDEAEFRRIAARLDDEEKVLNAEAQVSIAPVAANGKVSSRALTVTPSIQRPGSAPAHAPALVHASDPTGPQKLTGRAAEAPVDAQSAATETSLGTGLWNFFARLINRRDVR